MAITQIMYTELSFNCNEETFKKILEDFSLKKYKVFYDLHLDYNPDEELAVVSIKDYECGTDFEEQLKALNKICQQYGTVLEGYYIEDIDNDFIRSDFNGREEFPFKWNGISWLLDYNCDQIDEIHKLALEKFPQQPTDRSDSFEED